MRILRFHPGILVTSIVGRAQGSQAVRWAQRKAGGAQPQTKGTPPQPLGQPSLLRGKASDCHSEYEWDLVASGKMLALWVRKMGIKNIHNQKEDDREAPS